MFIPSDDPDEPGRASTQKVGTESSMAQFQRINERRVLQAWVQKRIKKPELKKTWVLKNLRIKTGPERPLTILGYIIYFDVAYPADTSFLSSDPQNHQWHSLGLGIIDTKRITKITICPEEQTNYMDIENRCLPAREPNPSKSLSTQASFQKFESQNLKWYISHLNSLGDTRAHD